VTRKEAAANREKVLDVAGALFRERGFDGIGVADIMKRAGLTHGGFYGSSRRKMTSPRLDRTPCVNRGRSVAPSPMGFASGLTRG
jgi:hypothetical protein